jgi:hypothetical protein
VTAIADVDLMWTCACTHREWNHYQECAKCGKERPAPPPEAQPSDISRPDPAAPPDLYLTRAQQRTMNGALRDSLRILPSRASADFDQISLKPEDVKLLVTRAFDIWEVSLCENVGGADSYWMRRYRSGT